MATTKKRDRGKRLNPIPGFIQELTVKTNRGYFVVAIPAYFEGCEGLNLYGVGLCEPYPIEDNQKVITGREGDTDAL